MKTYQEYKDELRNKAIDFLNTFVEGKAYFQSELIEIQDYFYKQGKHYGLIEEFKENGII